ncbi:MAG: endonuclease/exonuclease/phosphatase family protein [Lentimicrobium sp.]|nr:endonuclease/exonuclease/phosphatase family protein [Lentimicrobium sp.]
MRAVVRIFRVLLMIVAILLLSVGSFLAYQTLTDYRPLPVEIIRVNGQAQVVPDTLICTTYNIGYCGLGADMDFFYEGGSMVKPDQAQFDKYLSGLLQRLSSFGESDFILLQEVDSLAKRSGFVNEYGILREKLPDYQSSFGMNYKAWVPMPLKSPMGKVRAGILTLSKYTPAEAVRHAFESGYSWPMSLFMLKRCFVATRYKTKNGKDLLILNIHNSAFSDAAEIRQKELAQLKKVMLDETGKGNYVIVGGDWNQNPSVFDSTLVLDKYLVKTINPPIPDDFLPSGWKYAFDPLHSTNRDVDVPYTEGKTKSTLIDFFVISPNVKLEFVRTTPTGFMESDHQPVTMKVVLN